MFPFPPFYLQSTGCCPLYSCHFSVRIKPPEYGVIYTEFPVILERGNLVFLYPNHRGRSWAAVCPPPRHNSSIVPRCPHGPNTRRIPYSRGALDLLTGITLYLLDHNGKTKTLFIFALTLENNYLQTPFIIQCIYILHIKIYLKINDLHHNCEK